MAVLAPAQTARSSVRATETAAYAMLTSLLKEWNIDFSRRELMTDYGAFGASIEARFPAHPAGSEGGGIFVFAVPVFSPRQTDDAETPLNWGHELA
ncbi:MAG: hypothetical protein LBF80_05280, partial [Spirochaetaceae bacterium]|nr:hypothetical protein [Spirochaetaceae bacterium]